MISVGASHQILNRARRTKIKTKRNETKVHEIYIQILIYSNWKHNEPNGQQRWNYDNIDNHDERMNWRTTTGEKKKRNREIGRVSKKTYKVKNEIEKEQNQFN